MIYIYIIPGGALALGAAPGRRGNDNIITTTTTSNNNKNSNRSDNNKGPLGAVPAPLRAALQSRDLEVSEKEESICCFTKEYRNR